MNGECQNVPEFARSHCFQGLTSGLWCQPGKCQSGPCQGKQSDWLRLPSSSPCRQRSTPPCFQPPTSPFHHSPHPLNRNPRTHHLRFTAQRGSTRLTFAFFETFPAGFTCNGVSRAPLDAIWRGVHGGVVRQFLPAAAAELGTQVHRWDYGRLPPAQLSGCVAISLLSPSYNVQ